MVNLGPEAWDPNFLDPSDFGAPTPLQNAIHEHPLFKKAQEKASATPVGERKPDPDGDPICARCRRTAEEIPDYVEQAKAENIPLDEFVKDDGTYNGRHNMFLCDTCYVALGMPTNAMTADYMESAY